VGVSIAAHPTPELTELQALWTNARQVATDLEARRTPREDIAAAHSRAHKFREKLKSIHFRPAATLLPLLEEFYIDRERSDGRLHSIPAATLPSRLSSR
jgi:hypothetical protein